MTMTFPLSAGSQRDSKHCRLAAGQACCVSKQLILELRGWEFRVARATPRQPCRVGVTVVQEHRVWAHWLMLHAVVLTASPHLSMHRIL